MPRSHCVSVQTIKMISNIGQLLILMTGKQWHNNKQIDRIIHIRILRWPSVSYHIGICDRGRENDKIGGHKEQQFISIYAEAVMSSSCPLSKRSRTVFMYGAHSYHLTIAYFMTRCNKFSLRPRKKKSNYMSMFCKCAEYIPFRTHNPTNTNTSYAMQTHRFRQLTHAHTHFSGSDA